MSDDNIPILGQPARLLMWYPTAMIQCNCSLPALNLVVTTGFNNPVICGRCGAHHVITGLVHDGQGGITVELACKMPPQGSGSIQ